MEKKSNSSRPPFDSAKYKVIKKEDFFNVDGNDKAGGVTVEVYSYDGAPPRAKMVRWYMDRESKEKKNSTRVNLTGPAMVKVGDFLTRIGKKIQEKYHATPDVPEEEEDI